MKKLKLLFCGLFFVFGVNLAQDYVYHDTDRECLISFLCENAVNENGSKEKETNAHLLLNERYVNNWHNDSEWLEYLQQEGFVVWDNFIEEGIFYRRITKIDLTNRIRTQSMLYLSGIFDFSECSYLKNVVCYYEKITAVNLKDCKNLEYVDLHDNMITNADFKNCNQIKSLLLSNNKLLLSKINLTHQPDEFLFCNQEVTDSVYGVVWKGDELYVTIDLSTEQNNELFPDISFNWVEDYGILPENSDNDGIFYFKLDNLQKSNSDIVPITIHYYMSSHIHGDVLYTSDITRSMGIINIDTNPSTTKTATAYVYLVQNDDYFLIETVDGLGRSNKSTHRLPPGDYIIGIDAIDYLFSFYANTDESTVTSWRDERITKVSVGSDITVFLEEKPKLMDEKITIVGILEEITSKSLLKATPRVLQRSTVTLHSLTTAKDEWILVATTQTDDYGAYSFSNLPRKTYRVTVEIPGFENTESILVSANSAGKTYRDQNFLVSEETQTITANAEQTTSVLSNEEIQLSVYPNPVTDVIHINGLEGTCIVKIFNMTGQVVKSVMGTSPEITFHLNELSLGMYLLRIESQGTEHTVKVIKN